MNGSLAYHSVLSTYSTLAILDTFLDICMLETDPLRSIYCSLDIAISSVKVIHRELWHTVDDSCTVFAFSLQYWSTRFTPQHDICRFNLISYEIKCHLKSKRFYCLSSRSLSSRPSFSAVVALVPGSGFAKTHFLLFV